MTYKEFIPEYSVEALRKLAEKVKKQVPEFNVTFGEPKDMVFRHPAIGRDNEVGEYKMWHRVSEIEVTVPDIKEWRIVAYYEDGVLFGVDPKEKLDLKNGHGADYHKCDLCGHPIYRNMYIVRHKDGTELQVGGDCVEKFGLSDYELIARFAKELYRIFDFSGGDFPYDGEACWCFGEDKLAFRAIEKIELIRATYAYYKEKGMWEKSKYVGGGRYERPGQEACEWNLNTKNYGCTEEKAEKVCEYGKTLENTSEFAGEMIRIANNFYAMPADAVYAWYLIKNYEDHMAQLNGTLPTLNEGDYVKVVGKLISSEVKEGWYGIYIENTILTDTGLRVKRNGVVKVGEDKRVELYAPVISQRGSDILVGRMTKNPKKGMTIITI